MRVKSKTKKIILASFLYLVLFFVSRNVFALDGSINPQNNNNKFYRAEVLFDESVINMGWYDGGASVSSNIPVTITDSEVTGFAFAENYGWINMNCANTTTAYPSGICGTSDFKVTNTDGVLSGYAWGEGMGWINFGPPASGHTYPYVEINTSVAGEFVGYAWSENYGWILFDCTLGTNSCTRTDWGSACNDGIDNDGDGYTDYGSDPECISTYDTSEGDYQCSDGVDNDGDGFIDYPNDPQCNSAEDNREAGSAASSTAGQSEGITPSTSDPTNPSGEDGGDDSSPSDNSNSDGPGGGPHSGGGGSIVPDENPPDSLDIPDEAFDQLEPGFVLDTVDKVKSFAKDLLNKETNKNIVNTIGGAGAALAIGTTLPTLITLVNVGEIALIPLRLASLFLSALGIRRKKWGVVYDAVTKQPLDPVYVVLQDLNGNEVSTSITDLDGRYGFLVKKGKYKIMAGKTNYEFPAKDMIGKSSDGIYNDVYYGQEIDVPEDGAVLAYNIPMTPIGFDWNEAAKKEQKVMRFYTKRRKNFIAATRIVYYFGFLLSLFVAIVQPRPYTFVILGFYGLVFIMHRVGIKERVHGTVVDKSTGYGLPFSIIRVYSQQTGVQIKNCVADASGKYLCLLGNGKYKLVIEKKLPDGTYEKVHEKENVVVKKGVLSENFEL